jgi:dihydrolipoamide dehydrogenase
VIEADRLLSAAGVVPNIDGLQDLGVAMRDGAIRTDAVGRTSLAGLYAIGDVAGAPMLAHKAEHDGIACVEAIAGRAATHMPAHIPACIYANPQIASVGLSEAAAIASGITPRIGRFSLRGNGKALVIGAPDGLVKCVFDAETDRLIGAQIIGPDASELIHGLTIAVSLGATSAQLSAVVFPHPTLSEALHEAVLAARDGAIHA